VVLSRTLSKKQMLMSVATKIAIQLNCKMGGEVWAVEIPVVLDWLYLEFDAFVTSQQVYPAEPGVASNRPQATEPNFYSSSYKTAKKNYG